MHRGRQVLLLTTIIAVAVAAVPAVVNAQGLEVHDEADGVATPCATVTLFGHSAFGGCHAEFRSEGNVLLVGYFPAPAAVSNCQLHLEAQIGADGEGYVTRAVFSPPAPPVGPGCTRTQCDEAATAPDPHAELPWPIHINESAGALSAEIRICVRMTTLGEGASHGLCTLHLPIADQGDHNYEFGTANLEAFCEPGDIEIPVSFQGAHLLNETPPGSSAEDIELVH